MGKLVGISISVVGIVILIFNKFISSLSFMSKLPKVAGFSSVVLAGVFLFLLGAIVLFLMNGPSASREVPIYQGNKIIGYRRA